MNLRGCRPQANNVFAISSIFDLLEVQWLIKTYLNDAKANFLGGFLSFVSRDTCII